MNRISDQNSGSYQPLAERLRPAALNEFVGQEHLLGPGKLLRRSIESDQLVSCIFWGPPGTGKTTLARIMARETASDFHAVSAVTCGVADIRKIIKVAQDNKRLAQRTILFIDEIHRFNKAQQDALLHSVEDGTIILIGATTENPSFEVISALRSRSRVFKLEALKPEHLQQLIDRALAREESLEGVQLEDAARDLLLHLAGGDARNMLTALEIAAGLAKAQDKQPVITPEHIEQGMQRRSQLYDKKGDFHYDVISAFIKSVRGSDPDAAILWLARMLDAGEDPVFIARRLVILASEDIGNADPHGLMLATSAFQAVTFLGMPEARIILAQATTYLASAPKSNAAYLAIDAALEDVRQSMQTDVPLHLRNAPTTLMKDFDYGKNYKYPHNFGGFTEQSYFPDAKSEKTYYRPTSNGIEQRIKERLEKLWPKRKRS